MEQAAAAEAEREERDAELQALRRGAGAVSQEAVAKSRQELASAREKLAAEVGAREDVEDRCQKLQTKARPNTDTLRGPRGSWPCEPMVACG